MRIVGDFREGSIRHEISYHPEWEVDLTPDEQQLLDDILSQHFTYLAKGAQCYAFVSDDDHWVLKIFKFKHLRLPPWLTYVPSIGPIKDYKEEKRKHKNDRLERVFYAHKLSFDRYREESGLLYIHLNPTVPFKQKIQLTDKIGLHRTIDLDGLVFVVQERSTPLDVEMRSLLSQGDLNGARDRIRKIFSLYRRQYELGIYDWGHGVMHNNGFVGEKAIHFDVEKILADDEIGNPVNYSIHLKRVGVKMDKWISKEFPEYRDELRKEIDREISL